MPRRSPSSRRRRQALLHARPGRGRSPCGVAPPAPDCSASRQCPMCSPSSRRSPGSPETARGRSASSSAGGRPSPGCQRGRRCPACPPTLVKGQALLMQGAGGRVVFLVLRHVPQAERATGDAHVSANSRVRARLSSCKARACSYCPRSGATCPGSPGRRDVPADPPARGAGPGSPGTTPARPHNPPGNGHDPQVVQRGMPRLSP